MSYHIVLKSNHSVSCKYEEMCDKTEADILIARIPRDLFDFFFQPNRSRGKQFLSRVFQTIISWHLRSINSSLSEMYFEKNIDLIRIFTTPIWWTTEFNHFMSEFELQKVHCWLS